MRTACLKELHDVYVEHSRTLTRDEGAARVLAESEGVGLAELIAHTIDVSESHVDEHDGWRWVQAIEGGKSLYHPEVRWQQQQTSVPPPIMAIVLQGPG